MAQKNEKFVKVAHRGASGYEPENTLAAFEKAIDLKADMIELDAYVCKSGEVVVIHDDTVDRTTNGKGKVEEKTLTELKALGIPTLTDVLDIADKKIKIDVELKGRNAVMPVRAVVEQYVEKGWNIDNFMVSSFHHDELEQLREMDPEIRIGVLSREVPPGLIHFAKKIKAYSLNVPVDQIDAKFVENAHKNKLKVFVYAADNTDEIGKAKEIGADYICSKFPDKI